MERKQPFCQDRLGTKHNTTNESDAFSLLYFCFFAQEGCRTVAERTEETSQSISVLFQRYGVDIYNAGHAHEVTTNTFFFFSQAFRFSL
eukprot:COSAG06_NODE_5784_length_3275_cov_5.074985_3_plen_89_part_00